MKFLLLVLILALAYLIFKAHIRRKNRRAASDPPNNGAEDMVRCALCGVHLPRSESLMSGRVFYCSAEHRGLHQETN